MFNYFDHLLFRGDHQHKAAGLKIKISKTTMTTVHDCVSNVLWKTTAFLLEHYKLLEEEHDVLSNRSYVSADLLD